MRDEFSKIDRYIIRSDEDLVVAGSTFAAEGGGDGDRRNGEGQVVRFLDRVPYTEDGKADVFQRDVLVRKMVILRDLGCGMGGLG